MISNRLSLALLCLTALTGPALAIELSDKSELHGFINQAFLYSPDNPYAGQDANNGSFQFREAGLNAFYESSSELRFAGQVLARQRDDSDDGKLRVDFLLADYRVVSQRDKSFGIRAGRVKNNIGLYNATRDVPSARPGYTVPESIYFETFRDTLLSSDGINLYGSATTSNHRWNWEIFAGRTDIESSPVEYYVFDRRLPEGEYNLAQSYGVNLNYFPAPLPGLQLGVSVVDFSFKLENPRSESDAFAELITIPPSEAAAQRHRYVTGNEIDGLMRVLSAQFSMSDWIFSLEYLNLIGKTQLSFPAPVPSSTQKTTTEAFYGQAEWLPTAQLSLFARYEELYLDNKDRRLSSLAPEQNLYKGFGRGWTIGGKWNFRYDLSATAQASFNEGTVWLPSFDGMENTRMKEYWNYYVVSLNYHF